MSVTVNWALTVNTNETLETNVDASGSPVVPLTAFSTDGDFSASTTPPATLVSYETIPLVAGAVTIDLTALTGTNGIAVDGTNLKVQLFHIKNKTGNSPMTFVEGAATGYLLKGSGWKEILAAGQETLFQGNDAAPDITALLKHIDVTGTGTEEFELSVVMG